MGISQLFYNAQNKRKAAIMIFIDSDIHITWKKIDEIAAQPSHRDALKN